MKKNIWTKEIMSWSLYDAANSVFYTTVMAGFFPIFFKKFWSLNTDPVVSTERLGWILSIAGFLLAVLSPLLGIISDRRKVKKKLLFSFMVVGVVSTLGLYFVPAGAWFPAALLYGMAFFFCNASTIFYDSLIMSVSPSDEFDRVSSLGYALGYLAGGVVFAVNVLMYLKPTWFGFSEGSQAILFSFLVVGIWWFLLTLPLMKNVSEPHIDENRESLNILFTDSIRILKSTFSEIYKNKNLFYFLLAYWFYIDGVSTIMAMAVDYGVAINLDTSALIQALLLVQFIGFPAAYIGGALAKKYGSKYIVLGTLVIYGIVVIGATQLQTEFHFYLMATMIGLSQGSVQALSRSIFAQLIPEEKSGEYFGFFNLVGKFASIFGPLLMAMTARLTHDSRLSVLSLLILFILGVYFLLKVRIRPMLYR